MLKPDKDPGIPEIARLIAREAFPQGNIFLTMRDELGPIFEDEQFRDLYPALGQPAASPARLALVTVMQFVENLTDRQAAQNVRARINWKYALGLELSDPGFNYSVLREFRSLCWLLASQPQNTSNGNHLSYPPRIKAGSKTT